MYMYLDRLYEYFLHHVIFIWFWLCFNRIAALTSHDLFLQTHTFMAQKVFSLLPWHSVNHKPALHLWKNHFFIDKINFKKFCPPVKTCCPTDNIDVTVTRTTVHELFLIEGVDTYNSVHVHHMLKKDVHVDLNIATTGVTNVTKCFSLVTTFPFFHWFKYFFWWVNLKTEGPLATRFFLTSKSWALGQQHCIKQEGYA